MMDGELIGGRFALQSRIGGGGMGDVFRAQDLQSGASAAVKIVRGGRTASAERFAREAHILARLDHPGIVRYLAHGTLDERSYFLATELLEGEDLAKRLEAGPLTPIDALRVAVGVTEALALPHASGIIHRDIKPANIFLVDGDVRKVKLLDFGIARPVEAFLGNDAPPLPHAPPSATGRVIGTIGYMAPEQARGERDLDTRVDVFSLGCVLFECLTGESPFAADSPLAALARILLDPPVALPRLVAPRAQEALHLHLDKMLSKDRAARPADASHVLSELRRIQDEIERDDSGAAQTTAPVAPDEMVLGRQERRIVSLLALLPPRDGVSLQPDPRAVVERTAALYHASVEPLIGGALLVLSPAPATDQAVWIARCALALAPLVPEYRFALATGYVQAGAGSRGGSLRPLIERLFRQALTDSVTLDGDPLSVAIAAAPIPVDAPTADLLESRFVLERSGGFAHIVAERPPLEASRTLLGHPSPFLGRDGEVGRLLGLYDEVRSEPKTSAVLVTAPTGFGKSRLAQEFATRIRRLDQKVRLWSLRCDTVGVMAPDSQEPGRGAGRADVTSFAALSRLVAAVAEITPGDSARVRAKRVRRLVSERVEPTERERIADFLGEVVDAENPEPGLLLQGARSDPRRIGDQVARAWNELLSSVLQDEVVVILIDDVQWCDQPSLAVLAQALRDRARPLLLAAFGRPDAEALFSDDWKTRGLQTIRLSELSRRSSEQMVRSALGSSVPALRVKIMAERAGGQPLFLEELIRAEAEGRGDEPPATVAAVLHARLDRFETDARRVLRAASLFGSEFWHDGVAFVLGQPQGDPDLEHWLRLLREREVIGPAADARYPEHRPWVFRHALVGAAVYETLTAADRCTGHLLAGQWMESLVEPDPNAVARHFEIGCDLPAASRWLARAAQRAEAGWDLPGASLLAGRARAMAPSGGHEEGSIAGLQANLSLALLDFDRAEAHALVALDRLTPGTSAWYHAATILVTIAGFGRQSALGAVVGRVLTAPSTPEPADVAGAMRTWALCANMLYLCGQYGLAAELDRRVDATAASAAEDHRPLEPGARAWWHFSRNVRASYCGGAPESTLADAAAAADLLEQLGDREGLPYLRTEVGKAAGLIGDFERAEALLEAAVEENEATTLPGALALLRLARLRAWRGRTDDALHLQRAANAMFQSQGLRVFLGVGRNQEALFLLQAARLEEAAAAIDQAVDELEPSPPYLVYALSTQARVRHARGSLARARESLARADAVLSTAGVVNDGEAPLALARLQVLDADSEATGAARAARDRLLAQAATIRDPRHQRRFLSRVPENAAVLALAERLAPASGTPPHPIED